MSAKNGKFDVQVYSLKHLLEYRMDGGAKEYTFEVSLFAEQFNQMLQRDCAFSVYKALVVAPELTKDSEETAEKKADNVRHFDFYPFYLCFIIVFFNRHLSLTSQTPKGLEKTP